MADSPEEKAHWKHVLRSFDCYMQYHLSANNARRMAFLSLSKEDKAMYTELGFRDKLDAVDEGIRRNAEFIEELIADPVFADILAGGNGDDEHAQGHGQGHGHDQHTNHDHDLNHGHSHDHDKDHSHPSASSSQKSRSSNRQDNAEAHLAQDKIRSTLRSFVRDWSVEGQPERKVCYDPILAALEAYYPAGAGGETSERARRKVLVPGTGLGRLAMEIAARGFSAQGNEFSTYMLISSNYILNQTTGTFTHDIFPFLHSWSNHLSTEHHLLRKVSIPDVVPAQVLEGSRGEFSLVAGDFEEIYSAEDQVGAWDAVATCFFIDCARNPLKYLQTIHNLLQPSGVWINLGPLLWHFENAENKGPSGEGSIELSLDEVKVLAGKVGFDITEEKMVRSTYTGIPDGMLRHEYNAAFWVATKRKQ